MSVDAHRREVQVHAQREREESAQYDPEAIVERSGPFVRPSIYDYRMSGLYWGGDAYNPTEQHREHALKHARAAREHLAAARELERFEEAQCRAFPSETRVACPLLGQLESAEEIKNGIRVVFAEGIDVNAAVAHIRCHLAYAIARGRAGMRNCPLYLEGVHVSRVASLPRAVDITVGDRHELRELRRRIQSHL